MNCKGICIHYKAALNHYVNGYKRCRVCDLFVNWYGVFCPCCGCKLRTKPLNPKLKTKLREQERAIEEEATKKNKNIISLIQSVCEEEKCNCF